MSVAVGFRPAWVEVDLDAVAANVRLLKRLVAPARLCAVVKADAYGHGAVDIARAALSAGADLLAVALVEEGLVLRDAGIDAEVLLLSEPTDRSMGPAIAAGLTPTLYRLEGVAAARRAAKALGARVAVQLKVDTGMHRVGADPADLLAVARAVDGAPELVLGGLWTHFAVSDEPHDPFTAEQLRRLLGSRDELARDRIAVPLVHAANSAGAIAHPDTRLDMVRCGIALYGHLPSGALAGRLEAELATDESLRPALSWKAELHLVRRLPAGEATSYGRWFVLRADSTIGIVPLGYHDGVPRAYASSGGEVLVGGRRRRLAGAVTMDQLLVDLGDDSSARAGDEVVLIGRQGDDEITVEQWADRLGSITYEILCGIGPRVPRRYQ